MTTEKDQSDAPAESADAEDKTDEQVWSDIEAEENSDVPESSDEGDISSDGDGSDEDQDDQTDTDTTDQDDDEPSAPTEASSDEGDDDGDEWANATPDELRTAVRKRDADLRSNNGRVAGLQRKVDDLQRQLRDTSRARPAKRPADAQDGDMSDDELKRVEEEYPEVAGPLIKALNATRKQLDDTQALVQSQRENTIEAEEDLFLTAHSDGFDVINEDRAQFDAWVDDQPRAMRDIFARNRDEIVNGKDAAILLTAYKTHLSGQADGSDEPGSQGEPPPKSELSSKRQRQLEGARTVSQKGRQSAVRNAPPEGGSDGDHWDFWASQDKAG